MGKLDNRVAVITGGASGIGKAIAELFVKEGARVVVSDIQDELGETFAKSLGDKATYTHADVSLEDDVKSMIDHAVDTYGRLDCVVNNAGMGGVKGEIESIPVEGFDQSITILLRGVFLGMKHAAPVMKKQGGGNIINISSVAGLRGVSQNHPYSAAKAAVLQLTRTVAMELAYYKIRVNSICPGSIVTSIFGAAKGLSSAESAQAYEGLKRLFEKGQPIRRAGLPEDIANAALWLASDDSSFVTGHALVVDGGVSAGQMWTQQMRWIDMIESTLGLDPSE
ncbi:MAG: 2,5-dichloro-2,5-cyclohexadiene-1,4-diol dehydrogenase [Candidatus Thorarchaeota archaeon AB_25]|nr:MAG: 2,5-dichloro-2,5-cyclohexadiene-1,4-diol dehydrogenase [Candidatus Thorarchaeota archaeon AB_25]